MKTIGLLGGMSWESSIEYYRMINQTVREELGGLHSAKCVMVSVDFAEIEVLQAQGEWDKATHFMIESAKQVQAAGAECLLICTNTMHLMADAVQAEIKIPLIHIADATAEEAISRGLMSLGLLGTRFTMEEDFYRGRLIAQHGLEVLIPPPSQREEVHRVIYEELVVGEILPSSKNIYLDIIRELVHSGAQGVILGCTEIGLLVKEQDVEVPILDTAKIHANAAVAFSLGKLNL